MNCLLRVLVTVGKLVDDVVFWITLLGFAAYFAVAVAFVEGEGRMRFRFPPNDLVLLKDLARGTYRGIPLIYQS